MIKPHGIDSLRPLFVYDAERNSCLQREAEKLPWLLLNSAAAANAVMLGAGYFTPLDGYMDIADVLSVSENMRTTSGLFWPIPCMNLSNDVSNIKNAEKIALRDPNVAGHPILAVQQVNSIENLSKTQLDLITEKIFGTRDIRHPGVANLHSLGKHLIAGPIQVLNFSYFQASFPDTFRTAVEIRKEIEGYGWQKIVAFQTRNPMHRAHEELCKMVMDTVQADGLLIHMLLGKLKRGDIPANVRDAAIRKMVELYFPKSTVMVTGYGFDMLYAGPREALLHAIFRQNCGCTHLIIGRDHAGVSDYYGPFDAQDIFDTIPKGMLAINIAKVDHTAYSKKLNKVVMMCDVQDHQPDDFVLLSGTKVREMLAIGKDLPEEFARPEVAEILKQYYQQPIG